MQELERQAAEARRQLAEGQARRARIAGMLAGGLPEPAKPPALLQRQLAAAAALRVSAPGPLSLLHCLAWPA